MKILRYGSRGSQVQLLQLALNRAGFGPLDTDGAFGGATAEAVREFQRANGLVSDGVAGARTHGLLDPWYTGYTTHIVKRGDTLYRIAAANGVTLRAVETANPALDPVNLRVGSTVIAPLPFPVTPTDIDYSSELVYYVIRGITARYPFVAEADYGRSVMGKRLKYIALGGGERRVLYNAEHHANEWITTPLLLKFAEELAEAYAFGRNIYTVPASEVLETARIYIAPAVDIDGIDLVTGAMTTGPNFAVATRIAADFPRIPFPSGWKANIAGTDLNLQYPANWEEARRIKFEQGYTRPAPRDFVGTAPLSAPESRALYDLTRRLDPALTLSYHTQGSTIYWKYLDREPPDSRRLAECFAAASGYAVEETPYASGFAGYKDWFIDEFDRPGYTIEAGLGVNPLPISQFDTIYRANLGILTLAAIGC